MTNRIAPIDRHTGSLSERESLVLVEARKIRPNNFLRILGQSPAALGGYFALNDQIGKVRLGTRLREMISLAVPTTAVRTTQIDFPPAPHLPHIE